MTPTMPKSELDFYDQFWMTDEAAGKPANMERVGMVVDHALPEVQRRENPAVIDVGCGNGWILQHLKQRLGKPARLFGIEPSRVGAENARRKLPDATIWQGISSDIPKDQKFDVLISSEVIEHAQDTDRFLQDLADVMVDGGLAVITTPNGLLHETIMEHDREGQPRENHLTPAQLRERCGRHFTIEKYTTFNISTYYTAHPRLKKWRQRLARTPLLWRLVSKLDNHLLRRKWMGTYQLIVLRKGAAR